MTAGDTRPPVPASLAHRPVRGGLAQALEHAAAAIEAAGVKPAERSPLWGAPS